MERVPAEARTAIYYYSLLLFLAVILIVRTTRSRKGMRLKLGGGGRRPVGGGARQPSDALNGSTAQAPEVRGPAKERALNVVFNYNGHSWDAFEVLGLPAGSQLSKVEATFQQALREQSADSHPFLRAAFEAIRQNAG